MGNGNTAQRPPSPPHSFDGEYDMPFHANEHYQFGPFTPPRLIRPASSEPVYNTYNHPSMYPPISGTYYAGHQTPQPTFMRDISDYRSIPVGEGRITTRSGRAVRSSPRAARSPAPRKKKPHRARAGAAMLAAPISELTKDYDIPLKDMDAHVHRSFEAREKELTARKKKGKENVVPRPSNSFILYRMCYQEHIKEYMRGNNHQDVSKIGGASWALESKEVRDRFEKLAVIERENHTAAFPEYKFQPNKAGKKRAYVDLDGDEDDDSDGEWEGSRSTKRSRRGHTRSTSSTPFDQHYPMDVYGDLLPRDNPSSFHTSNPHVPSPFDFGALGMDGYYTTHTTSYPQEIHDMQYQRLNNNQTGYEAAPSLIGLPDAGTTSLLNGSGGGGRSNSDHFTKFVSTEPSVVVDPALSGQHYAYTRFDAQETSPVAFTANSTTYELPRSLTGYVQYPELQNEHNSHGGISSLPRFHPGNSTLSAAVPGPWQLQQDEQAGSDFDKALDGI